MYRISSLHESKGLKKPRGYGVVWGLLSCPWLLEGPGGQRLALTAASLPSPLQVQALPEEICADAGLSRSLPDIQWPRPLPCPSHLSLSSATQPFPHQGTPVLGPATPPLAGGLCHMTNCAPRGCVCCCFFQNCSGGKFGMPGRSEGTRPRVLPLF